MERPTQPVSQPLPLQIPGRSAIARHAASQIDHPWACPSLSLVPRFSSRRQGRAGFHCAARQPTAAAERSCRPCCLPADRAAPRRVARSVAPHASVAPCSPLCGSLTQQTAQRPLLLTSPFVPRRRAARGGGEQGGRCARPPPVPLAPPPPGAPVLPHAPAAAGWLVHERCNGAGPCSAAGPGDTRRPPACARAPCRLLPLASPSPPGLRAGATCGTGPPQPPHTFPFHSAHRGIPFRTRERSFGCMGFAGQVGRQPSARGAQLPPSAPRYKGPDALAMPMPHALWLAAVCLTCSASCGGMGRSAGIVDARGAIPPQGCWFPLRITLCTPGAAPPPARQPDGWLPGQVVRHPASPGSLLESCSVGRGLPVQRPGGPRRRRPPSPSRVGGAAPPPPPTHHARPWPTQHSAAPLPAQPTRVLTACCPLGRLHFYPYDMLPFILCGPWSAQPAWGARVVWGLLGG